VEDVEENTPGDEPDEDEKGEVNNDDPAPYHLASIVTAQDHHGLSPTRTQHSELHSVLTKTSTRPYTRERFDVEQQLAAEKTKTIMIAPTKTLDGTILVD